MADVRLVDLPMIKRYSLAIRQESAPAEELLGFLDASREVVLAALEDASTRPASSAKGAKGAKGGRA